MSSSKTTFRDFCLCVLSAVLLVLSFPPFKLPFLAWIALIPFLFAVHGKTGKSAFFLGWMSGFLFFFGTMYWFFYLIHWFGLMVLLGIIILFLYLGMYWGLFGLFCSGFFKDKIIIRSFLIASSWVVLEFIRSKLFTGFDWGSLGHTQFRQLSFIQIADVTGVFGISFLVILVNIYLKEVLFIILNKQEGKVLKNEVFRLGVMVLGLVCLTVIYGIVRINGSFPENEKFKVAVIQGNIEQDQKWSPILWPGILTKYMSLTREALAAGPELIIWPETSFPEIFGEEEGMWNQLLAFVKEIKTPLLVGLIEKDKNKYYNSAFLISPDGKIIEKYRKMHLVPFGEFFPFRSALGFIADMLDIGDFSKGEKMTVFSQGTAKNYFSVLICFEDTVSALARKAAQENSQLFINMTNDAWFGNTHASILHMQSAVFRSIENRRNLIRAANTGVSCFIDLKGKIRKGVEDKMRRAIFVDGFSTDVVSFHQEKTLYTKFGDVFAYLCFGCILSSVFGKGFFAKDSKWKKRMPI